MPGVEDYYRCIFKVFESQIMGLYLGVEIHTNVNMIELSTIQIKLFTSTQICSLKYREPIHSLCNAVRPNNKMKL